MIDPLAALLVAAMVSTAPTVMVAALLLAIWRRLADHVPPPSVTVEVHQAIDSGNRQEFGGPDDGDEEPAPSPDPTFSRRIPAPSDN